MKDHSKRESQILTIIGALGEATAARIINEIGVSKQRFYVLVAPLIASGQIIKRGTVPHVFYTLNTDFEKDFIFKKQIEVTATDQKNHKHIAIMSQTEQQKNIKEGSLQINNESREILNDNFYTITPDGREEYGVDAFINWCHKRHENLEKTLENYLQTIEKYKKFKNREGLIEATHKIEESFGDKLIKKLYYLDFYSIERYGKTRLGQMILYAKKSHNKNLSITVSKEVKSKIEKIIIHHNINAIAYIPPTEQRKYQFMNTLRETINSKIPLINIMKVKTDIIVPQKTLNKIEDRVTNAANTIFVSDERTFDRVLLIDDAVGSGATFHEVARKLIKQKVAKEIYAVSIVGSFNGFEVINEA